MQDFATFSFFFKQVGSGGTHSLSLHVQAVMNAVDNADRYYRLIGTSKDGVSPQEQAEAFIKEARGWIITKAVSLGGVHAHAPHPSVNPGFGLCFACHRLCLWLLVPVQMLCLPPHSHAWALCGTSQFEGPTVKVQLKVGACSHVPDLAH